jgi:hypothetical protein
MIASTTEVMHSGRTLDRRYSLYVLLLVSMSVEQSQEEKRILARFMFNSYAIGLVKRAIGLAMHAMAMEGFCQGQSRGCEGSGSLLL